MTKLAEIIYLRLGLELFYNINLSYAMSFLPQLETLVTELQRVSIFVEVVVFVLILIAGQFFHVPCNQYTKVKSLRVNRSTL